MTPTERKTNRKPFRKITPEERELIIKMWNLGDTQRKISNTTGRSEGAISHVIKKAKDENIIIGRLHKTEVKKEDIKCDAEKNIDLSKLPDTILFDYTK